MQRDLEHSERHCSFGYHRCIHVKEVKGVIRRMRRGRVTELDEILMIFWKNADRAGMEWLIELFNIIFGMAKMPEE